MGNLVKERKLPIFISVGKSPIGSFGGGYPTYSRNLATVLTRLGHQVFILALGNTKKYITTDYGQVIHCPSNLLNIHMTALPALPIYTRIFADEIQNIMDKQKINRCIVWGIGPWGYTGYLLKQELGKRIIHLNHYFTTTKHEWGRSLDAVRIADYGLMQKLKFFGIYHTVIRYLTYLEKKVLTSSERIITNYRSTEKILEDQFGIASSKFYRSSFTVEVYKRSTTSRKEKQTIRLPKKFILFMSRHDPRKGINFLLHAMKLLQERHATIPLVIAGTGELFNANKKLAEKLNLNKSVQFIGFIDDPLPILQKAYAFCFPTIEEGAGALMINELMGQEVPIITTACDGIVEDITDRKTGLLVPMKNPEKLARAIETLWKNPSLTKQLGQNAKKEFNRRFSLVRMATDIEKLISLVSH